MRLIDADKLLEELEKDRPYNWTDTDAEIEKEQYYYQVFETVEEQPTVNPIKWHKVEDELPKTEPHEPILIRHEMGGIGIGFYRDGYFQDYGGLRRTKTVAWCEIPMYEVE